MHQCASHGFLIQQFLRQFDDLASGSKTTKLPQSPLFSLFARFISTLACAWQLGRTKSTSPGAVGGLGRVLDLKTVWVGLGGGGSLSGWVWVPAPPKFTSPRAPLTFFCVIFPPMTLFLSSLAAIH